MRSKTTSFIQTLFREQNIGLRRFVASRLADEAEAEDIAQEAFHHLMRVKEPEKLDNPKAYLYKSAANLALNRIRKRKRQQCYENTVQADMQSQCDSGADYLEDVCASTQELEQVLAALNDLPDKVQRAFMLSRADNKTYREISQQMGVSISCVEKYLICALKHLREQLPQRGANR